MRLIFLPCFITLLLFAACSNPNVEFVSEAGNFSVCFPVLPEEGKQSIPSPRGDIHAHIFSHSDSVAVYLVAYSDVPGNDPINADSLLQNAKIGPAAAMRTTLVEEKPIKLAGKYPGLYFKALGLEVAMVYEIYLVDRRMYQIGILNSQREPSETEIRNFIKSFKLLNP